MGRRRRRKEEFGGCSVVDVDVESIRQSVTQGLGEGGGTQKDLQRRKGMERELLPSPFRPVVFRSWQREKERETIFPFLSL